MTYNHIISRAALWNRFSDDVRFINKSRYKLPHLCLYKDTPPKRSIFWSVSPDILGHRLKNSLTYKGRVIFIIWSPASIYNRSCQSWWSKQINLRIEHRIFWCTYMGREYHILLNLPRSSSLWRWYPCLHRYLPCVEILTDWNHLYVMRRQERYSTPTSLLEPHMKPNIISPSYDPDLKHPAKRPRRLFYIFGLNLT
jgi:hypothetical protein